MSSPSNALPRDYPVLVTGAGGFVGGHVARALAAEGYVVRGLTRRPPQTVAGDPPIEWVIGDLRESRDRDQALAGMRGVIHTAGWVSLGPDPSGMSHAVNVEATRALLGRAAEEGVERFVYTSTLWTVAAGTSEAPADESSAWNLDPIRSPYCDSKREAERIVLERDGPSFRTAVLCPGLVVGPRDVRPTSTRVLLEMSRFPLVILPRGGIPVVDAQVVARAHIRALELAESGRRFVVAGPYLSYLEMATLVAAIAGKPWKSLVIPDAFQGTLERLGTLGGHLRGRRSTELSAASVAGGFLRLHVSGALADAEFGLSHPHPARSVFDALDDSRRAGRAPWLRQLRHPDEILSPVSM